LSDNIDVQPGERPGKVAVATDEVGGVHYPIYKLAVGSDGAVTLIDADNGVPVTVGGTVSLDVNQSEGQTKEARVMDETVTGLLTNVLKELRIMNIHLSMMTDNEITRAELD